MSDPLVSIIIRSFNEGWALRKTLAALKAQDYRAWELIVIDSGSTDDSVELIRDAQPAHFVQISKYHSSRVMNEGMLLAKSEFCIFLNADATPQGRNWLRPLVTALQDPQTAAVFGRQIPRPDCKAVFAADYERCFGENRDSARWQHFFSMVSSGIRKSVWAERGFDEELDYSEDDEYTRWCLKRGFRVEYVPESVVMHSHNYTPAQAYQRWFGEGRALAVYSQDKLNFLRTVLMGCTREAHRDLRYCLRTGRVREFPHALRIRWQQRRGKLAGWEQHRA